MTESAPTSPSWAAEAIDGPSGGPTGAPPARHRLRQLERWLDYAVDLGCSGLLLGPIFAALSHGYDTTDHFRIDPRLGDDADFDRLAAAARQRGLPVVLDGVFNHVGRGFAMFMRALADGPDSAAAGWFLPRRELDGSVSYLTFEGHDQLVALNHGEPAVAAYVTAVMNHWRARHRAAWFTAEMIHGDYARYAADSGIDSVTQYELWKAIWSSLNDRNFFELAWALDRHDGFLGALTPLTFVGNHDVTRIASQLSDPRHLGHALAVLFSVGGTPAVYYGDEQGLRGVKEDRAGGDDAIRPAYPADPAHLPASGWNVYRLHQQLIALRRRHGWLSAARTTVAHLTNRAVALQATAPGGGTRVITLLNVDDRPQAFPLDVSGLVTAETLGPAAQAGEPATVPAHAWRIIVTRPGTTP